MKGLIKIYTPLLYKSSPIVPTFSVRPRSSVSRVTVDLIRRSWVRFPPRSKDLFFSLCGSLIPFTRANAQWGYSCVKLALKFGGGYFASLRARASSHEPRASFCEPRKIPAKKSKNGHNALIWYYYMRGRSPEENEFR